MTVRPLRGTCCSRFSPGFFSLSLPRRSSLLSRAGARFYRKPSVWYGFLSGIAVFSFSCKTPCPVCFFCATRTSHSGRKPCARIVSGAGVLLVFRRSVLRPHEVRAGFFIFREDRNTDLSWHLRCICGSPFRQPQDFCGCFSDSGCFSGGGSFSQKSFSLFPHKAASAGKA